MPRKRKSSSLFENDRLKEQYVTLKEKFIKDHKEVKTLIDNEFTLLVNSIPLELLELPLSLKSAASYDECMRVINEEWNKLELENTVQSQIEVEPNTPLVSPRPFETTIDSTVRRRRSRSVVIKGSRLLPIQEKRSSSVSSTTFQTPLQSTSSLLAKKTYTVIKDRKEPKTAGKFKRIMRAGEEVISTEGSPLIPAPVAETQLTINLPGGLVFSIKPEEMSGQVIPAAVRPQFQKITEKMLQCLGSK